MAIKTRGSSKLTTGERKELMTDLCGALQRLESPSEVAEVLADLMTPKEIETISKRLQIAELLVKGHDYLTIRDTLKVGYSTIARVNTWLNLSGKGFKIMLAKKNKARKSKDKSLDEIYDPYSWHNLKRKYTLYFWPQLLIEEFFNSANQKERKKMEQVMENLDLKAERFRGMNSKDFYESLASGYFKRNK